MRNKLLGLVCLLLSPTLANAQLPAAEIVWSNLTNTYYVADLENGNAGLETHAVFRGKPSTWYVVITTVRLLDGTGGYTGGGAKAVKTDENGYVVAVCTGEGLQGNLSDPPGWEIHISVSRDPGPGEVGTTEYAVNLP